MPAIVGVSAAITRIAATVVSALLAPFLAPGPAVPAQPPLLWAVLAYVRNEIQRTFFNHTPQAVDDSLTTDEGTAKSVDVLTNDVDGEPLRISSYTEARHGDLELNADGTFTYTPDAGFVGTDSFTYTVTDAVGPWHAHGLLGLLFGGGHTQTANVAITVNAAAALAPPTVTTRPAIGNENTPIDLDITAALQNPRTSDTLAIIVDGVPAGAVLNHGVQSPTGSWTLTKADLEGLTITPPPDSTQDMTLTVTAIATRGATTATTTATLAVTVNGVASPPVITTANSTGTVGTPIALNVNVTPQDTRETLPGIVIGQVPATATLNHGVRQADGSWALTAADLAGLTITPSAGDDITLVITATTVEDGSTSTSSATLTVDVKTPATIAVSVSAPVGYEDTDNELDITVALHDPDGTDAVGPITITGLPVGATMNHGSRLADGRWVVSAADLGDLTYRLPDQQSRDFVLTVRVATQLSDAQATASTTVSVTGVPDAPAITTSDVSGEVGELIPLGIAVAFPDDDGSEVHEVTIFGVPDGAALSHGTLGADGGWTVSPGDLDDLVFSAAGPGGVELTIVAAATEAGTTATSTATLFVSAFAPAVLHVDAADVSGAEDTVIPLTITIANDRPGRPDPVTTVTITGVPPGATLNHGSFSRGTWTLSAADLEGLELTPALHDSGTYTLTITAVTGRGRAATDTMLVTVVGVADRPTVTIQPATGAEDSAIPVSISVTFPDNDGSETQLIRITADQQGFSLSAGTYLGANTWQVTEAQLVGLTMVPPQNFTGHMTLIVSALALEGASSATSNPGYLTVTVTPVADPPNATAANVSAAAGSPAQLAFGVSGPPTGTLSFVVHGVPAGFTLSRGLNNGDNTWTLTPAQIAGVTLVPPPSFTGQLTLHVTAVVNEGSGVVGASAPTPFTVQFGTPGSGPQVAIPVGAHTGGVGEGVKVGGVEVDLFPASGTLTGGLTVKEDTPMPLADAPSLLNSTVLGGLLSSVTGLQLSDVPAGTTFSAGTNLGGGVWRFTPAQLVGLTMTTPPNSDVDFTMTASATLLIGPALPVSTTNVRVLGVADAPTVNVTAMVPVATSGRPTEIALNVSGALADTDGSETSSYLVSGMPAGFRLNRGIDNGNGTWSLTSAELNQLVMTAPTGWTGTGTVTVSHVATEREGSQAVAQRTTSFTVTAPPVV